MVKLLVERVWSALDLDQVASRLNEAIIQSYNDNCPLLNGSRTTTISGGLKVLKVVGELSGNSLTVPG